MAAIIPSTIVPVICPTCFAGVMDRRTHVAWHAAIGDGTGAHTLDVAWLQVLSPITLYHTSPQTGQAHELGRRTWAECRICYAYRGAL